MIIANLKPLTRARVSRQALANSITRVSAAGFDPSGGTSIHVTFSGQEICVDAIGENENQSVDYCAAEIKGPPVELGVSWKYLRSILDTLEGADEVEIALMGARDPMIFTPVGSQDFLRLVAPVDTARARKNAA
jgi:hypothetical protein